MKQIVIVKAGEEGAIHLDALEGRVTTSPDERPEWANGLANAMLVERAGWYAQRLGIQLTDTPEQLFYDDLEWLAVDEAGDEVHIEANGDFRMNILANAMGLDRENFESDNAFFAKALSSYEVNESYSTSPTDEATLGEVEGKSFAETEKQAVTG